MSNILCTCGTVADGGITVSLWGKITPLESWTHLRQRNGAGANMHIHFLCLKDIDSFNKNPTNFKAVQTSLTGGIREWTITRDGVSDGQNGILRASELTKEKNRSHTTPFPWASIPVIMIQTTGRQYALGRFASESPNFLGYISSLPALSGTLTQVVVGIAQVIVGFFSGGMGMCDIVYDDSGYKIVRCIGEGVCTLMVVALGILILLVGFESLYDDSRKSQIALNGTWAGVEIKNTMRANVAAVGTRGEPCPFLFLQLLCTLGAALRAGGAIMLTVEHYNSTMIQGGTDDQYSEIPTAGFWMAVSGSVLAFLPSFVKIMQRGILKCYRTL